MIISCSRKYTLKYLGIKGSTLKIGQKTFFCNFLSIYFDYFKIKSKYKSQYAIRTTIKSVFIKREMEKTHYGVC